jgi:hypothetical protein
MPIILASWEAEIGRKMVQGQTGQIVRETSIFKITRAKWTGGMAHEVELLLCNFAWAGLKLMILLPLE